MKEAEEKVRRLVAEAKARAEERRRKDEERRRRAEERRARGLEPEEGGGDGGGDGFDPVGAELEDAKRNAPKGTVRADFADPREFAAFLRVWAADRFARQHGHSTLAQAQQDRLFAEFYRICARRELGDLADRLLAPKGARAFVNRRLQDLEKGVRPDTVERISANVFAFINKAAIRETRVALVAKFRNDVRRRYFRGSEFDQMKQDSDRKVTGWVEEAARYVCRVCDLSKRSLNGDPSAYERECADLMAKIGRREKVYDDAGREVAEAAASDMETVRAMARLALLDRYGAMTSLMPGQILDLQDEAFRYFEGEARKLEERWRETRERQDAIRGALTAAIAAPNGRRYRERGWLDGRLFDALNGLLRLRLEHLTRFAPDDARARAKSAIDDLLVMLGDGETAYARALQEDRAAFFAGLARIFQKPGGGADNSAIRKYLERMDEPIPEDLSRRLSRQGWAGAMTRGQMLQLLVSLEQGSFRDAIRANGREGQAQLIRGWRVAGADGSAANVFTREDAQFVDWLRSFYERKRGAISRVTMRMTGHEVLSPDPLYCPLRRYMEDVARGLHGDPTPRWDPISKAFSRRVESSRDFDESRSVVGMFFEASEESARLVAWAERGTLIRNVFTSAGVQGAIRRAFGAGELGNILAQLEATFNGGRSRSRTPGEIAAADRAMNFITYAYLSFNPLSALKQTTSFATWANALPNGFKDLWRHMTHVDMSVVRHIMESEEYKVRYGDGVGGGHDLATKGLYENPSASPLMRAISGAGMKMLKWGDFAPGAWIAQGVYKDLLDRHMRAGMDYGEADRRAMTETFNLIEETQQSARTYNTNRLAIEHGRLARLLTQFATSPLQQLQYETQAWREWRDMARHGMGEGKVAAARRRFWRAALINHVILPAAMELVVSAYRLAMGEEPPWEREGAHWDFLVEVLLGQFSSVFFLGALTQTTLTALFRRERSLRGVLPVEGAIGTASSAAFLMHDLVAMDAAAVRRDLERAIRSTAPTRVPYDLARRVLGDSDADRKRKRGRDGRTAK